MAKVLVVDDDSIMRKLLRGILNHGSHEVIEAETGASGVSTAELEKPDVIIMDLNMPDGDGFKAVEKLRQSETTKMTPVLILSGEDRGGQYDAAYNAGATAFMTKPVDGALLLARIQKLLQG